MLETKAWNEPKNSKNLNIRSFQSPIFETRSSLKIGFVPGFSQQHAIFHLKKKC